MRINTLLAVLTIWSFQSLVAQDIYYTINIGTFLEAKAEDFGQLNKLGFLHSKKLDGNLSQIYLGGYTDANQAATNLNQVRSSGYTSAYLQENFLSNGQNTTIVQLATLRRSGPIDWPRFAAAGDLYVTLDGDLVKMVLAGFKSLDEARQAVNKARQLGFRDAFIKNVNSVFLHPIGAFESNNTVKKPLIPLQLDESGQLGNNNPNPDEIPDALGFDPNPGNPPGFPPNSGNVTSKSPNANPAGRALPNIRAKIKRRSAMELQKVLQDQNVYNSGLDGYYGAGTKRAYDQFVRTNKDYKKYLILTQYGADPSANGGGDRLQAAINNLPSNPAGVEGYPHYMGKVYQAYVVFNTLGPRNNVNNLMNTAIKEAFAGQANAQVGFNPNATYAYNDLQQLLLHMFYVHGAEGNPYTIPCWLSERHPNEFNQVNASFAALPGVLKMQNCGGFNEWKEIQILNTIADEFTVDAVDETNKAKSLAVAAGLYNNPNALSTPLNRELEQWNTALWQQLNNWSNQDPIHRRMTTSLKVAYFQSQVRLEDFFMDKGFKQAEAKGLALASLRALVGLPLQRFTN